MNQKFVETLKKAPINVVDLAVETISTEQLENTKNLAEHYSEVRELLESQAIAIADTSKLISSELDSFVGSNGVLTKLEEKSQRCLSTINYIASKISSKEFKEIVIALDQLGNFLDRLQKYEESGLIEKLSRLHHD